MKDFLVYIIVLIFLKILRILPLSLCKKIGLTLGRIFYHLAKARNKIVRKNLKKAFPEYPAAQCEKILENVYYNLGMMIAEVMLLERFSIEELKDCVSVEGEEYYQQVKDNEKGVILYSAHFDNWEWLGIFLASLEKPLSAIAKEQSNIYFNKKINGIRSSKGLKIITKDLSLRKIYKRLLKGEILYILGDQDAGKHGWITKFFGRQASTSVGPVRFAAHTGADILPVFIVREGWLKHKVVFYPPYKIKKGATKKEQLELLQELTTLTENVIRENPDQWFWLHRRWKSSISEG